MAINAALSRAPDFVRFLMHPVGKILIVIVLLAVITGGGAFIYYYNKYAKVIDDRLKAEPTPPPPASTRRRNRSTWATHRRRTTSPPIFAAPATAKTTKTPPATTRSSRIRSIFSPASNPISEQEPAAIRFSHNKIDRIVSLRDNTERPRYDLEPQLVTNLHDRNREKQRLVRYDDIPPVLRDAILSAEDKRFFTHPGFDIIGILRAAGSIWKRGGNKQGASTLTMQLARYMFLDALEKPGSAKPPKS